MARNASQYSKILEQLESTRRQAMVAMQRMGSARLAAMLARAAKVAERNLPPANGTFTSVTKRQAMTQLSIVTKDLQKAVDAIVRGTAHKAATAASQSQLEFLVKAESMFRGSTGIGPRVEDAVQLDTAVAGADASVLRRVSTDPNYRGEKAKQGVMDRYGASTMQRFEEVIQESMLSGEDWASARMRLTDESMWLESHPRFWAERIVRTECLLGDTLVSGAVVNAALRRWYDGNVVEIVTEGGRKFTTTPNHPMLTRRSWVHAGELNEGDYLVCYCGEKHFGTSGDEHVTAPPTTIAEIFDSLSAVGVGERRRTAEPDFHGDGRNGYVDILRPHRVLEVGSFAPLYKPVTNRIFSPSNVVGSGFCRTCGRLLSIQHQPCRCGVTWGNALFQQAVHNEVLTNPKFIGELFDAITSKEALAYILSDPLLVAGVAELLESVGGCIGTVSDNSSLAQDAFDGVRAGMQLGSNPLGAQPSEIEFDRVVSIRWLEFHGHVYNLATPHGYYTINGAYTGNTMAAYNRAGHEVMRQAEDAVGKCVRILCAHFDDRTGWDSYQVHGQVRRMEEPFEDGEGRLYMVPPNRPNDREIVILHAVEWPLPEELLPKSDEEVLAAWMRQRKKGVPPPRPKMSTVKGFGIVPGDEPVTDGK